MENTYLFHIMPFAPRYYFYLHSQEKNRVLFEYHENYQKRGLRNRYFITGSQGVQRMTVPLKKGKNNAMAISKVQIAYESDWRQQHLRAIRTNYGSSPYFEHYFGTLVDLFKTRFELLLDFNFQTNKWLLEQLVTVSKMDTTNNFDAIPPYQEDFRVKLWDKSINSKLNCSYDRLHDLNENDQIKPISFLDSLFFLGPEALLFNDIKHKINGHN